MEYQYPGLLKITGKSDHIAGGTPDYEKAIQTIEILKLPEFFRRATQAIVEHLQNKYPEGLQTKILEVKSCSAFMWDIYERFGANKNHACQIFHYLKADNLAEGHIVYLSKDDLRMLECGVLNPSPIENIYKADIETMTNYYNSKEIPPIEKIIVFEETRTKFAINWKVSYSQYLTKLYNLESQQAVENIYKKQVAQWNRTFGRCAMGKDMTKLNKEVIVEIKKEYPDFDGMVQKAKETNVNLAEEIDE